MSLNAATKKLTIMTFHKVTLCDLLLAQDSNTLLFP